MGVLANLGVNVSIPLPTHVVAQLNALVTPEMAQQIANLHADATTGQYAAVMAEDADYLESKKSSVKFEVEVPNNEALQDAAFLAEQLRSYPPSPPPIRSPPFQLASRAL